MKRKFAVFLCVLIFFNVNEARSEDKDQVGDQIDKRPTVTAVVSATRREMPIEESTRFVTVITSEQIEKSGKIYVD